MAAEGEAKKDSASNPPGGGGGGGGGEEEEDSSLAVGEAAVGVGEAGGGGRGGEKADREEEEGKEDVEEGGVCKDLVLVEDAVPVEDPEEGTRALRFCSPLCGISWSRSGKSRGKSSELVLVFHLV